MVEIMKTIKACIQVLPVRSISGPVGGANSHVVLEAASVRGNGLWHIQVPANEKSVRGDMKDFLRTWGRAIVFTDFNAPYQVVRFGVYALFPFVAGIAHH
jgi:hypothetical protein